MSNALLDEALYYAMLGWRVIPLFWPTQTPNGTKCACKAGLSCKAPGKHPIFKDWLNQASADPQLISDWWSKYPLANVGIATGSISNLVVIDIDPRHAGDQTWKDLTLQNGQIPNTIEAITGGGGRHIFFQHPGGKIVSRPNQWPGVDIRADGAQVVAAPSVHASGRTYEWDAMSDPHDGITLAQLPVWLKLLFSGGQQSQKQNNNQSSPQPKNKPSKNNPISAGQRNSYLTSKAGMLRKAGFSRQAIEAALLLENQEKCAPPLTDQEVKTIAGSVSRYQPHGSVPTDDELAKIWIDKNPESAYGLGEFRRYENGYWSMIHLDQIRYELLEICEEAKMDGFKPTKSKLDSILHITQIKAKLPDDRWNSNPDLVVCSNGTLEIATGTLRPHAATDYVTGAVPFPYDPNAEAPTWKWYFQSTVPDAEPFLQEYAGYSLTTDTRYETAVWLWGPAGSGKSTFIEGLTTVLGDRAGVLGLADIDRSSFGLTQIPGKTLLVSTEQPATFIRATHLINELVSGEPIQIDRKFRDSIRIRPFAKLLWSMNELPRISEAGNGIFRRVKVIEFPVLPESKRNVKIKDMICQEGSGVLNWALEGLKRLRDRGCFDIPQSVKESTQTFVDLNDVPKSFMDDMCIRDSLSSTSSCALYEEYRNWCIANGNKPQSSKSVAMDWKRLGLAKEHTRTGEMWKGVRIKP